MSTDRGVAPEVVLGLVVAALGIAAGLDGGQVYGARAAVAVLVVALATGGIVAVCRRRPGLALVLVWLLAVGHLLTSTPVLLVELAFVVVAFAAARWGSPLTVALAGLSIPAFAGVVLLLVAGFGYLPFITNDAYDVLLDLSSRFGDTVYAGAALVGSAALGVPWLLGLALRFQDRAASSRERQAAAEEETERAHREAEQAREIARLRDEQAQLARDVHDVVGHSLAVILAQAESAQYLPDTDTDRLKQTMATIATSARSSLQDVRHVLTSASSDQPAAVAPRGLDTLVDGVRASGHEVVSRELGTPQPLPPDLEVVAYRVLQEMLTNAIKHGSRDEPVFVERHWPDGSWAGELRIEVRNSVGDATPPTEETQPLTAMPLSAPTDDGRGLDGMRRRLEACGGRLDVRRRDGEAPGGTATFTTTAWVPVRTPSP